MSNLIGVRLHCGPGDEMICEAGCHIYNYEQAGYAQLSGVAARTVEGRFGVMQPEQLEGLIRPSNDHLVRTRLVCLENTHNRGGGRIQPYEIVEAICRWAHENGLRTHLDGARLFSAVVATGIEAPRWAQHFDTVSVCFSKGLGAPVGSALAGSKEDIAKAIRHRKVLGGGMRQAGIIARRLADGIRQIEHLEMQGDQVDTNLLFFDVGPAWGPVERFLDEIGKRGLLMLPTGPRTIRAVTHLDVDGDDVDRAIEILGEVARLRAT
jgi:threonine aldolase